jgi:hypothetical protein
MTEQDHVVGAHYVRTNAWRLRLQGWICPDGHPNLPSARTCRHTENGKAQNAKPEHMVLVPQNKVVVYENGD